MPELSILISDKCFAEVGMHCICRRHWSDAPCNSHQMRKVPTSPEVHLCTYVPDMGTIEVLTR